jgi:hypothetical protein
MAKSSLSLFSNSVRRSFVFVDWIIILPMKYKKFFILLYEAT